MVGTAAHSDVAIEISTVSSEECHGCREYGVLEGWESEDDGWIEICGLTL